MFRKILDCIHIIKYIKLNVNITRTFYNNSKAIIHLEQNLRKHQALNETRLERSKRIEKPKKPFDLTLYFNKAPNKHDFFMFHFNCWWKNIKLEYKKYANQVDYEQNQRLGSDMASALFILKHKGRVKFKNSEDWIEKIMKNDSNLPTTYDVQFVLEAIDLKGYPLEFDNINNICNLYNLKWLSLKGCDTVNDWFMDKLAAEYPMLEYFDVSECINLTERGLEALYKMANLKKLIVTNHHNSVAFDLTCFLLEDVNPYLTCVVLKPEKNLLLED
ncbi:distal membrane arm assembly component 2 [Ptiloglossa arizonensis]|uniref:distal membrane arm assembly component 2 n=1 Tax=Ptiloglossa arizonensis TaxID=3350558 RepID=UPI003FA105DA